MNATATARFGEITQVARGRQVIQNLKPWLPAPPRMRSAEDTVAVEPVQSALVSTALSSQDDPAPTPPAGGDSPSEATGAGALSGR